MAIPYPYLPEGRGILYAPEDNEFIAAAKELARQFRSNLHNPAAAVVVKDGRIIGSGSVGNNPTHRNACIRIERIERGEHIPTGTGYDLCPGCSYEFHSEAAAVRDAKANGHDTRGADLYLWGHWWACEPCWQAMIEAGIDNVYLLQGSEHLFNKAHPDNVIGRQFE